MDSSGISRTTNGRPLQLQPATAALWGGSTSSFLCRKRSRHGSSHVLLERPGEAAGRLQRATACSGIPTLRGFSGIFGSLDLQIGQWLGIPSLASFLNTPRTSRRFFASFISDIAGGVWHLGVSKNHLDHFWEAAVGFLSKKRSRKCHHGASTSTEAFKYSRFISRSLPKWLCGTPLSAGTVS